jgi:hypothetical protein
VREKIEASGRDARWEFSKQALFARTNYGAEICRDLIEMVELVEDFFKFLGPELKAVTGGCQQWAPAACLRVQLPAPPQQQQRGPAAAHPQDGA